MEKKFILIVDDQEEQGKFILSLLENEGYGAELVRSGEEALELYNSKPFNLVLTDVNMSGISGIELLRSIKAANDDAVVILLTGFSDMDKSQQAIKYGAADYLLKPLDPALLLKSIRKALSKDSSIKEKRNHQRELERNVDEITETLKFQKEALEREQERTRGIIEAAHIGFLVLDAESEEIFLINKRGKELLRIADSGDQGIFMRNYTEIFSGGIAEILKKILIRVQKEKTVVDCGALTFDESCILSFAGYPLTMGGNLSSIVVIVIEDITEKKVLEKQILQSSRLADIGELAAVVGHEINNPIAFIKSNTYSLSKYFKKIQEFMERIMELENFLSELNIDERKILDIYQGILTINGEIQKKREEIRDLREKLKITQAMKHIGEIIEENLSGLDRIKKIVLDLKTLSYMGEEKLEEADINKILNETLDIVWNQIKFKAQVIRKYGQIPILKCYSRQLSQVFTNILMNAAQAIEKHGTITVATRYEQQAVMIEIADTGCGMDEVTLKRLFTPFFTTKKIGKGTGLGLSICYKIVEKHKGKILVKSESGKGSVFSILLPLEAVQETHS